MSLYDKASLVQIPSGTKAGKLYSVLPANGDGDFTHTRATSATRVNKDGLIESVASGVPRLDYPLIDGVVQDCPALLLEPSRYNNLQRSEEFDNAYWNKSLVSVTPNDGVSPDGSVTADKIVSGNSTGAHFFRRTGLNFSASTFTFSIFAKFTDDLFEQFHFVIYDGSNHFAYFDVKNGVVGSADAGFTTSMVNYGNGWYRCIASYQTAAAAGIGQIKVELGDSTSETGDGTSGMLFWGIQWELGSHETSYIPTTSATVTRNADVCNGAGTSAEFNDSEGVLFLETAILSDDGTEKTINLYNSSNAGNRLSINYRVDVGRIQMFLNYTGATATNISIYDIDKEQIAKLAFKYKNNDMAIWYNGFELVTDVLGTTSTSIGFDTIEFERSGGSYFYGNTKQLMVFNEALTDSELEQITSWTSFSEMAKGQLYTIE